MRFGTLSKLKRQEPLEIELAKLPEAITITRYAMDKAFKINELIVEIHKQSCEWYGFTLAERADPETVIDIGLPSNDQNVHDHTGIGPEKIARYLEGLTPGIVINGWIHSHGALNFQLFSSIDEMNHLTVLDYVTALLRKPVAKREVIVDDLVWYAEEQFSKANPERGNVCILVDVPVGRARILETIYAGFSYGIVIGDSGWHRQQIHYKHRGILTGQTTVNSREAGLVLLHSSRVLDQSDLVSIEEEVRENIQPTTRHPLTDIDGP